MFTCFLRLKFKAQFNFLTIVKWSRIKIQQQEIMPFLKRIKVSFFVIFLFDYLFSFLFFLDQWFSVRRGLYSFTPSIMILCQHPRRSQMFASFLSQLCYFSIPHFPKYFNTPVYSSESLSDSEELPLGSPLILLFPSQVGEGQAWFGVPLTEYKIYLSMPVA